MPDHSSTSSTLIATSLLSCGPQDERKSVLAPWGGLPNVHSAGPRGCSWESRGFARRECPWFTLAWAPSTPCLLANG